MALPPHSQNLLLIISGPAGSGKTTLCEQLLAEFGSSIERVVTTTSRDPRPGEVDGVDYHFITVPEFEEKIRRGDFIEWARVHGRFYGSERSNILRMIRSGRDVLLNIDVQGAQTFRKKALDFEDLKGRIRTIFIRPRSLEQIRERLVGRGADDATEIRRRLQSAEMEIQVADTFDHVITSGSREKDWSALRQLYLALERPES